MNNHAFAKNVDTAIANIQKTLINKGKEYATGTDRLEAFKQAAALQKIPMHQALGGMMAKHTVSIFDMLNKDTTTEFTLDQWDEKLGDHLNYLILLRAIVVENESFNRPRIEAVSLIENVR